MKYNIYIYNNLYFIVEANTEGDYHMMGKAGFPCMKKHSYEGAMHWVLDNSRQRSTPQSSHYDDYNKHSHSDSNL